MRLGIFAWFTLALAGPLAAEPWREAASAHFVIYSQESEAELRDFATRLERLDKALRTLQASEDPPLGKASRLTVYVVRDAASVRRLLGEGPKYTAGFYTADAGQSLAFTPRLIGSGSKYDLGAMTVLIHEYAHHYMWRTAPAAYPAWYVEGFAEFWSTARFETDGGVGIGLPAYHRAPTLLLGRNAISLAEMLGETRPAQSPDQLDTLYGRGWLLAHYLTFDKARSGQLARYLDAINRGTPPLKAATDAFGPLEQLDRELRAYVGKRLSYLPLPAARLPVTPPTIRTLRAGEAAILPIAL
ncbi:MAG: hypothetical protein EOP59_10030, partial [Sphingomonadales bacterium]